MKQNDIKWFLNHYNIGLFGLLESRVKAVNFHKAFPGLGDGWCVTSNYSKHNGGRIWVIWLAAIFQVTPEVLGYQFIHLSVAHKATGNAFSYTMVYGLNDPALRLRLWDDLRLIKSTITGAWMVGGDFNNVLNLTGRIGSPVTLNEVEKFRDCLGDCELVDMATSGSFFTWNNKQEGGARVCSKIDRCLINSAWIDLFPHAVSHFSPEGDYDHCPCVVSLFNDASGGRKPFRFFNMWTSAPDFLDKVQNIWNTVVNGTKKFSVITKLKMLKPALKALNMERFTDVEIAADIAWIFKLLSRITLDVYN